MPRHTPQPRDAARHASTLAAALVAAGALLSPGCGDAAPPSPAAGVTPAASPAPQADGADPPGSSAAPAELPRVDLAGIQGIIQQTATDRRVLVIDFWATWCLPCVEMFPSLHAGLKELAPEVRPVTITLDAPGSLERAALAFLEQNHAIQDAYMLLPDSAEQSAVVDAIGPSWHDVVVPAVFVYGRDGQIAGEFIDARDPKATAILIVRAAGEAAGLDAGRIDKAVGAAMQAQGVAGDAGTPSADARDAGANPGDRM